MGDLTEIAEQIRQTFPDGVKEVISFRGETTVVVDPAALIEVAAYCREADGLRFNFLSDLAGIDYYPEEPRFAVSYVLLSLAYGHVIRLKVYAYGDDPVIPSLTGLFPAAEWPEREVWDMFGVKFEGNRDLRRILMPFDWTGHPLRKDYPLGYEEVQFSFNYDRVQSQKPFPRS